MTVAPGAPYAAAVLEEALRKPGVLWVAAAGNAPVPVWVVRVDTTVYVLCGGVEQSVPGLARAVSATVSARSREDRALLVTWDAAVAPVPPDSEEWAAVVPHLLTARLNLPDSHDEATVARWVADCNLLRLTPAGPPRARPHIGTDAAEGVR